MSINTRIRAVAGGLSARIRAATGIFPTGPDLFYLAALLVPAALLDLTLSFLRVTSQYNAPTGFAVLGQLRSDILAHLGLACLWLVAFGLLRTGRRRLVLLIVCHLSVATYLLFAMVAHGYYRKSGSILDAGGLRMIIADPAASRSIAASEASGVQLLLMAGVVVYALLGPALLYRLRYQKQSPRGRWLPGVGAATTRLPVGSSVGPSVSTRHRLSLLTVTIGFALILASAFPTLTGAGAFGRNRALDIAMELGAEAVEGQQASAERLTVPPSALVPEKTSGKRPKNVVLITMESVRLEATSLGDSGRDTTPFLADLAKRSTVAENAYTVLPHTSKALTASNCGFMPPMDTKLTESEPIGLPSPCLPTLLSEQGYATGFFQSAVGEFERRPALTRNLGYRDFFPVEAFPTEGFGRANYFGWEDDIMLEPSREWLRQQGDQPFLLTYLTVTGHHDYTLPASFELEHYSDDEEFNNYLNDARYVDRFVSKVFDMLSAEGHAKDTMVVVIADHGEGFGEHGLRQHDNTIYNEGIKVPYLVYDPTDQASRTVERPVSTRSVPATIADVLGYRLTGGMEREGSLYAKGADEPIRVSCQSDNRCMALIDGTTKYITHFGNRPDEVFDLATDPEERDNLIGEVSAARLKEMRSDLLHWRSEVRATYAGHRSR